MDAEELVHCHTVAKLLVNRLIAAISQRFGSPDVADAATRIRFERTHHPARAAAGWREDDTLGREEFSTR